MKSSSFFKPMIFMLLLGIALPSFATSNGFYVGGQLGWENLHQGEYISNHLDRLLNKAFPDKSIDVFHVIYKDTGLGERLFAGYQFNPYFATEVGFSHFQELVVDTNRDAEVTLFKKIPVNVNLTTQASVNTYAVDLVGKFILPVTERFSIYSKAGAAYLNADGKVRLSATANTPILAGQVTVSGNPSLGVVYPTYGFGINYDVTQHVSADLSWMRIQKISKNSFPSTDFVGVGVSYHF